MEEIVDEFIALLEAHGYEDAEGLVETLADTARETGITLLEAARNHANQDEEQDTSWFQLSRALNSVPPSDLKRFDVHLV